ncbi:hypothetical protein ABPG77_000209 [Micractinium sp. CCAP 211/92]
MPAPVAPAPSSRAGRGQAVKTPAVGKSTRSNGGASPPSAMQAGLRRSRLQFLLDIAHATFSQPSQPTAQQIDALRRTLSSVPLEELGLGGQPSPPPSPGVASNSSSRSSSPSLTDGPQTLLGRLMGEAESGAAECQPRPPITYLLIYEDERISLGVFCLPARARIPLHNHPGMTVMSRVLYGQMHVSSYDWLHPAGEGGGGGVEEDRLPRPARTVLDRTFTNGDAPAVLFPRDGGNIHQFTALTDCAVLDLMSPPYSTEDGRDCTYYSVLPAGKPGGAVMLDAYEPPADFIINQGQYRGVQPRKPQPIFAGTSLFPAGQAGQPAGPEATAAGAQAAVPTSTPPTGDRSLRSPMGSPTSESTGAPKLSSLLAGGQAAGSQVMDSAASGPGGDCPPAAC